MPRAHRRSPAIRRHTLSGIARTSICVAVHKVKLDANDRANSSAPCGRVADFEFMEALQKKSQHRSMLKQEKQPSKYTIEGFACKARIGSLAYFWSPSPFISIHQILNTQKTKCESLVNLPASARDFLAAASISVLLKQVGPSVKGGCTIRTRPPGTPAARSMATREYASSAQPYTSALPEASSIQSDGWTNHRTNGSYEAVFTVFSQSFPIETSHFLVADAETRTCPSSSNS